jgi:uncharacterized protein YndB with AHSA1/START domain
MTIAPIVRSVQVKAAPARAFALFTSQMAHWWPKGRTIGKNPHVEIVMQPHAGGQWFERDADGAETAWGRVLTWEPPARVVLAWQINSQWTYDPDFVTELSTRRRRHAGDAGTPESGAVRCGRPAARGHARRRLARLPGGLRGVRGCGRLSEAAARTTGFGVGSTP